MCSKYYYTRERLPLLTAVCRVAFDMCCRVFFGLCRVLWAHGKQGISRSGCGIVKPRKKVGPTLKTSIAVALLQCMDKISNDAGYNRGALYEINYCCIALFGWANQPAGVGCSVL